MTARQRQAGALLPRSWPRHARSAVLHAISLASTAFTIVSGHAIGSRRDSVRRTAEAEALRNEVALLREELRLKDARMERLLPSRRPHYSPLDRMAILELRSRRGWAVSEAGKRFHFELGTIEPWLQRRDRSVWNGRVPESACVTAV